MTFPWDQRQAGMQIPFARDQVSNLYSSGAVTSAAVTFAANPKAGATVLLAVSNNSGNPAVVDNGVTPSTFTRDISDTSQINNAHIYRAANITMPASGAYQITVTGIGIFAAAAVSYVAPFGLKLSTGLQDQGGASTAPNAAAKGMVVFAMFADSNTAAHTVTLASPGFYPQFTLGSGTPYLGAFGVADYISPAGSTTQTCTWTLGAASRWASVAAGYIPGWSFGGSITADGNIDVATAGNGLRVAEGSNARQGTAALTAGSAVVANTSVTATSRIFLTSNADGGTPGWLRVSARTAGTSFTITSSSGTDTSTVAYEIFEPG